MAQEIRLKDGRTALFDDDESQESINQKLKAAGLEREGAGQKVGRAMALINQPIVEGVSTLFGLPGAIESGAGSITQTIAEKLTGRQMPESASAFLEQTRMFPTPSQIERGIKGTTGIQTQRAEGLTGQMLQDILRNLIMAPVPGAAVPAVVSGVGENVLSVPFQGTAFEPYARAAGGIAAPAAYGVIRGRSPVETMAREEMSRVSPSEITAARQLQRQSAEAGAPVTAAEAIQRATGESRGLMAGGTTRLPELQRMIEASRGGAPIMREFMGGREAQAQRAIQQMFPLTSRAELGADIQQSAQAAQRQAASEVSQRVGPMFRSIESVQIPKDSFDAIVKNNEIIKSAYSSIKKNPIWKEASKRVPENSVGTVEIMRDQLSDQIQEAYRAGQNNKARILTNAYDDLKRVADDAVGGDYQAALTATRRAREEIQRPLESTPIARIAETSQTPQQFASLFSKNAVELNLTPNKVKQTVKAFAQQDPLLARDFVGQYIRAEFDKIPLTSQRELRKGARFADNIFGNETQKQNLLAAYETAYGKNARVGFERLINGLKTQAERLPVGSPTAEKAALAERSVGRAKETIARPFTAIGNIADAVINGRDMEKFARAITSPNGVDELEKLATKRFTTAQTGAAAVAIQRLMMETE